MYKKKYVLIFTAILAFILSLAVPVLSQTDHGNQLGCQKNNPDRLDCSSLEVTGYCEGNVAVFTIRNTGEAGNGDMVAPTLYALVVNGDTIETGESIACW